MLNASTVRLHYAKAGDLGAYLNMVAIRGGVCCDVEIAIDNIFYI